jgi:ubiquitin-protein ligase
MSRQDSVYLPCGSVQVYFPNAEASDLEAHAQQKVDVAEFKRLQIAGDQESLQALKKKIMAQRVSLAHRYTTILIEYKARQGMYKGGTFQFLFRLPKGYPIKAPLCHCLTPIWHPNILNDPDDPKGPREQNVCCSYLHDASFADKSEEGYVPGMSLWKVVW